MKPINDPTAAADAYDVGLWVEGNIVTRVAPDGFEIHYADGSSSVHAADGRELGRWAPVKQGAAS